MEQVGTDPLSISNANVQLSCNDDDCLNGPIDDSKEDSIGYIASSNSTEVPYSTNPSGSLNGPVDESNEDSTGYVVSSSTADLANSMITNSKSSEYDTLPAPLVMSSLSKHYNIFDGNPLKKKEQKDALQIMKYLKVFNLLGHNFCDPDCNQLSINYVVDGIVFITNNVNILRPMYADKDKKNWTNYIGSLVCLGKNYL